MDVNIKAEKGVIDTGSIPYEHPLRRPGSWSKGCAVAPATNGTASYPDFGRRFIMLDFRNMRGADDLPLYLGISDNYVQQLVAASVEDVFNRYQIPKRGNRGTREIWEVKRTSVADMYKGLAHKFRDFFVVALPGFPHTSAHGYVTNRSTLTNARVHLGQHRVLCTDIRQFFRSISCDRVRMLLIQCGINEVAAASLAHVLSWQDHIPLGLHTSPVIANAVCQSMDQRLMQLVPGGFYTRYGDDLFFSGPSLPTRDAVSAVLAIDGFEIAERKWSVACAGRGLYVTGLSLEDGKRPRAPKSMKRRIRQDLYYAREYGLREHLGYRGYTSLQSGVNKIHGTIQYLRGIERELGIGLHDEWMALLNRDGMTVTFVAQESPSKRVVLLLFDESVLERASAKILLLCLVVVEDVEWVSAQIQKFCDDCIADTMTSDTERVVLKRSGIHWNDLSPDSRTRATALLRSLPFRAFIAYSPLVNEDKKSYSERYGQMLSVLLRDRMIRYDGCSVKVLAEENSKVHRELLAEVSSSTFMELEASGARRPAESPTCQVIPKGSNAALPLPDLVLGVFGDFVLSDIRASNEQAGKGQKKRISGAQAINRYEQIGHKIKAVYDLEKGAVFSRKNPMRPWSLR